MGGIGGKDRGVLTRKTSVAKGGEAGYTLTVQDAECECGGPDEGGDGQW